MTEIQNILDLPKTLKIPLMLTFLTTWSFILVIFHKYTHKYVDLFLLTSFVFVLSMYISLVNPGYIKYGEYKIVGRAKHFLNAIVHILPLVFIVYRYRDYYRKHIYGFASSNALLIILIYILMFDLKEQYDVNGPFVIFLGACFTGLAQAALLKLRITSYI